MEWKAIVGYPYTLASREGKLRWRPCRLGLKYGGNAGQFEGNVLITGDATVKGTLTAKDVVLANGDLAEDFDIADTAIEPGTVVILDESGRLTGCCQEYDKRVAGVISGAGSFLAWDHFG